MRHVLIINGHQKYDTVAEGKLTQIFINTADKFFKSNGFDIKHTVIEDGYSIDEELEKLSWAYYILFQYPVYWSSLPWMTKKYIDEVFSAGQGDVTYENDGRSRKDPNKHYGQGGLMRGKCYMLSMTYNCPQNEFSNPGGFFGGLSVDEANVAVHKIFQFCGLSQLKTYSLHDIYKGDLDMQIEKDRFTHLLKDNFL